MKRFFIAINFPKEIKNILVDFQKELSRYLPEIKWIKENNLHLTLIFLGNVDNLEKITYITKEILEQFEPFTIRIAGLGLFPDLRRPKIAWVGIKNNSSLKLLNQVLYRKLTSNGINLDNRSFMPHVTIGRIKKQNLSKESIFFTFNKYQDFILEDIEIKNIEIMSSEL
ncbi:MAG: RNA 2',3'-cyclic phosphodiesterase [Candidatus Berkelbacteria bacterium]|nr:RNA 2',3'-cyclic phosphodiesterase [Candidatus Berkelbacteria bacterium]